jgi:hypothetical protein
MYVCLLDITVLTEVFSNLSIYLYYYLIETSKQLLHDEEKASQA